MRRKDIKAHAARQMAILNEREARAAKSIGEDEQMKTEAEWSKEFKDAHAADPRPGGGSYKPNGNGADDQRKARSSRQVVPVEQHIEQDDKQP